MLRVAFPRARFLVRLDGGVATPELFDFLDADPGLDYVLAMAENAVLTRFTEPAMVDARTPSEASGQTEHVYTQARYAAGTWAHARRALIKAEVVRLPSRDPRDNPQFVVTNLRPSPRFLYEHVYCARGDIENRIKELHDGLQIGRTSCGRFWPNQLRVLLTAACVLMQELRLRPRAPPCARTQVTGLREGLLKLGVTSPSRSAPVRANPGLTRHHWLSSLAGHGGAVFASVSPARFRRASASRAPLPRGRTHPMASLRDDHHAL